jgi:hypothetical protein
LRELSRAMPRSSAAGCQRSLAAIALDALDRRGGEQRDPQPAVGGEALLRGEVVDVDLGEIDGETAAAEVASTTTSASSSIPGPRERHHHAGRRLVVGERVDVDAVLGRRERVGSGGMTFDGSPRCGAAADAAKNFDENSPNTQVLAALADQTERGGVPERRGRSAVAEQHLVAVGQAEQLGDVVAQRGHLEQHGRLAVARAEVLRSGRRRALRPPRADLRGAAPEASVGGEEVGGDP